MVRRAAILFLLLLSCLAYGQRGPFTFHDTAAMGRLHSIMHPAGGSGGSAGDYFNSTLIWIQNDFSAGVPFVYSDPYPSVIHVTDLTGQIVTNATVTINGWNSSFMASTHMDLFSPNTNTTTYLLDLDGGSDGSNLTITLSDASTNVFSGSATITNGTYRTSRHDTNNDFIDMAGINANGDWGLGVYNTHPYSFAVSNYISTGWSLHLDTVPTNGITIALSDTNLCLDTPGLLNINVAGETAPYTTAVVSGALPDGCFITGTNTIAGTPTNSGPFTFKIRATDDNGKPNFASFTVTVRGFLTASLPDATIGIDYSNALSTTFFSSPSFYITSGSLPGGLTLGLSTGLISGNTTNTVTNTFTVMVSNSVATCSKAFTVISSTNATLVTASLIHYIESDVFDGSSDGASVSTWSDLSGGGHDWTAVGTPPTVNGTNTANGHKTVRFEPSKYMQTAKFFASGYPGLHLMAVFKLDADPPVAASSRIFIFNHSDNISEQPYSDGDWYEGFARTSRGNTGNAVTNAAAAFVCYEITSKADGSLYGAWLNAEVTESLGSGYTYQRSGSESFYFLGDGSGSALSIKGSIAAIYIWSHSLIRADQLMMRTYINNKWGTSIIPP